MRFLLVGLAACVIYAQSPAPQKPFTQLEERVAQYMNIRKAAEAEAGRPSPTPSPEKLQTSRKALAKAIAARRASAKQGDIFTPPVAAEFKQVIAAEMNHHGGRISESIKSGALVVGHVGVNQTYPEHVALENMPPSLLAVLPKLPRELDYRLVGSTLILRDVDANLILDFLPNAVPAG